MPSDLFVARIIAGDVSSLALALAMALYYAQTSQQANLDSVVARASAKLQTRFTELMRQFPPQEQPHA